MLEESDTGRVEGVAGVKAGVGVQRPHFSFRVVTLAQHSSAIATRFDHTALVLVNECAGSSEVGSLFLRPERRQGGAGRLLAQSRYMLIGAEPARFADQVIAELRGWFDEDGSCPFWETVGCKFFRLPFDEADRMSASTDGQFILDLAPRHPIYVELLPDRARESVGRVHRDGEAAFAMLQKEGFRPIGLVDIFDAGPTVAAHRDDIRTVRDSLRMIVRIGEPDGATVLISTDRLEQFRAVTAKAALEAGHVAVDAATADALGVRDGDAVRVKVNVSGSLR